MCGVMADELNCGEVFESTRLSGSTGLSCQNPRADILHAHVNMRSHELRCMCLSRPSLVSVLEMFCAFSQKINKWKSLIHDGLKIAVTVMKHNSDAVWDV